MNLSPIVSKHIPEFVNDDYPLFVKFIKTYYKWLDETQINSIEDVVDIDTTLDSFVKYFRSELDVYGIKYQYIDERLYLKHVKQFYLSKGSEAAYWFLFRILFNVDSAIIRPWDYTFIPSNAQWTQEISIFINVLYGDGNIFTGNTIVVIGDDNKEYNGRVKSVIQIGYNRFELFLDKEITGNIKPLNRVKSVDNTVLGILEPVISKIVIETTGKDFRAGDIYEIDNYNGKGARIIIKDILSDGGIKSVELINFGYGYNNQFNYTIFPNTNQEYVFPNYNFIINDGAIKYVSDEIITNFSDGGNIVNHNYLSTPSDYMNDISYVGKTVASFNTINETEKETTDGASLRFYIGYTCKYPGYYLNKYNVLGQPVYIEDSYYYQIYSYVTALDAPLHKYKAIVNNAIHPIGNKLFSSYIPTSKALQILSTTTDVTIYKNSPEIISYVNVSDSEIVFDRTIHYYTSTPITDNYIIFIGDKTFFNDSFGVEDNAAINATKKIADEVSFVELVNVTRLFNEAPTVSESFIKTITKILHNNISISDNTVNDPIKKQVERNTSSSIVLSDDDIIVLRYALLTFNEPATVQEEYCDKHIIKRINDNIAITNTVKGYYGTLYVEQTPTLYWDLSYYDKEFSVTT